MNSSRRPRETIGAGLAPLEVLPVFLRLRGRRAVVAGGDVGALWKARLLSAAGAEVWVFAPDLDEDAAPDPVDGPILLHRRDWQPADLDGAAFAIAALPDEAACAAFVACARARGVIANAVDRPDLCDVQFGAIVNRSPLVVGISTAGAAPIFAQRLRSAIEALMPPGFAAWGAAASRWRDRVGGALAPDRRRSFWERFSDAAFARPDQPPREEDLADWLTAPATNTAPAGSVVLVGAGPGDPELLTLKAVRALRSADIVLYDDLVADEILGFARREARTMLVGKTGHGPSCRQEEINELMVGLAQQGRRVVRLKGGDPLVFARAADEIDACRHAAIAVEIVPGITAAQGAAAALGASLTYRSGARRVQFVTAHDRHGGLPDLDWAALADPTATTAIYMPRRHLAALMAQALAAGLPAATPAAAVLEATRPGQAIVRATVGDLVLRLAAASGHGPMIVLIGDAVRPPAAALAKARSDEPARASA